MTSLDDALTIRGRTPSIDKSLFLIVQSTFTKTAESSPFLISDVLTTISVHEVPLFFNARSAICTAVD